jgi:transposase
MRYELADCEWAAIKPMLPNKPRGVPRVNYRRVLNGIFCVLRSGETRAPQKKPAPIETQGWGLSWKFPCRFSKRHGTHLQNRRAR